MKTFRILISGSGVRGSLGRSFRSAFDNLGWDSYIFDDAQVFRGNGPLSSNRYAIRLLWRVLSRNVQRAFLRSIAELSPDVVLVLKGFHFSPATLTAARALSATSVLVHFNPDNSFNSWHFGNSNTWIRKSIGLYDAHFTWGKFLIQRLLCSGAKQVFYSPFACDPQLHALPTKDEMIPEGFDSDISFIGSWDRERESWLSGLSDYKLGIWGNSWDKAGTKVRARWKGTEAIGKDFARIVTASKININLIRRQNVPAHNMRTFEIPACGGVMLATRTKEQGELLMEGKEIACFSTLQELRSQVDLMLPSEGYRAVMAERARERVMREHTYEKRAVYMADVSLGLIANRKLEARMG